MVEKISQKTVAKFFKDYNVETGVEGTDATNSAKKLAEMAKKPVKTVGAMLNGVKFVNERFEDLTRLSYYISLRESGESVKDAAVASRDVSVDFNQHGDISKIMNVAYAFSNASLVSTGVVFRTIKNKPSIAFGLIGLGMLQAAINDALAPKDENGLSEWDKRSKSKKATTWAFWTGDGFV